MNEQARRPDAKRFAAGVEEIDRIDDQVRTPRVRLEVGIPAIHQLVPPLAIDQRDLPLAALVRISGYPAACDERRTLDRSIFPRCARLIQIWCSTAMTAELISGTLFDTPLRYG